MRSISPVLAVVALAALPVAGHGATSRLDALKWKARPVIVLSDSHDDSRVARELSALDGKKAGLSERNIKVLLETDEHGPLHQRLGLRGRGFAVVLVGKDGGVKQVWHELTPPERIFFVIDQMPMRRQEMNG